jgi:hypothetical protein
VPPLATETEKEISKHSPSVPACVVLDYAREKLEFFEQKFPNINNKHKNKYRKLVVRMELLRTHVPFIREMISNVKTAEYRKKWENMLNMIVSEEILSASQIETLTQNIEKAQKIKQQYESKSPQSPQEQVNL